MRQVSWLGLLPRALMALSITFLGPMLVSPGMSVNTQVGVIGCVVAPALVSLWKPDSPGAFLLILATSLWWLVLGPHPLWASVVVALLLAGYHLATAWAATMRLETALDGAALRGLLWRYAAWLGACALACGLVVLLGLVRIPGGALWLALAAVLVAVGIVALAVMTQRARD